MARLPRGVAFTPAQQIAQANRITKRGRVNVRGRFTYNTQFPRDWSRDPQVRARFEELLRIGLAEARRRVPVGESGTLRSTIEGEVKYGRSGIIEVVITAGGRGRAPYWAFVEFGTGRRGARTGARTEPGTPTGWRYGAIDGQVAQPFLRPALLVVKRRIGRTASNRSS